MTTEIQPTRVEEFIKQVLPCAHGHQIKAITKFVLAIIENQTVCQAELARAQVNQEAVAKQISRLIHNPRLMPKDFAKLLCLQALPHQVPRSRLETWYLVSNLWLRAEPMAKEYGFRFCCEEGFRDAKWYLGVAEACVKEIGAWSRLFALFAITLLVFTTLGMALLIRGGPGAKQLLRRVVSRRKGHCELDLIAAIIALVQQDRPLFAALSPHTKFDLEATLSNMS